MAYKNKTLTNPHTGHTIKFLQTSKDTGGRLLEVEGSYPSRSIIPPPHYHPYQEEDFLIIKGQMTLRMDGKIMILRAGDSLHIPPNTPHSMWNNSGTEAIVNWKIQPALDTEYFFETTVGLAVDSKLKENGRPKLFESVLMVNRFSKVFRLSKPPYFVQKIVFAILTPLAYLLGYRPAYKKYFD
jgi:quercetin dioxygenase-like cupin family protein